MEGHDAAALEHELPVGDQDLEGDLDFGEGGAKDPADGGRAGQAWRQFHAREIEVMNVVRGEEFLGGGRVVTVLDLVNEALDDRFTAGCIFPDQPPRIAPRGPTWGDWIP